MDFCEGGEGSASGPSGKISKVSAVPSPEKPPPLPLKKDNVPVLPSSLPNESALVPGSEDDSDTNETLHNAEAIPDKAHATMSPSPLSPRRTRNLSLFAQRTPSVTVQRKQPINPAKAAANKSSE